MKNLNKVLIAISLLTLSTSLYSQRMTVKGGLNLSKIGFTTNDPYLNEFFNDNIKPSTGFNLGITSEFKIAKPLAIETGLIFSTKGFMMTEMEETYKMKVKLNLYYIDVPLNLKVSQNIGKVKVYGTAGPYIGIGLLASLKMEETYSGETHTDREFIVIEDLGFKHLDYGVNAGIGVEIKAIQIGVNYGYGLQHFMLASSADGKITNKVLSCTVG